MKKERGITLIALVITIIVLLILAGVSITMLTGDNGILTQAQNAKDKTEIASEKEAIQLTIINYRVNNEEKYNIGEKLYDRTLQNGDKWNVIVEKDTNKIYGTDWNYIEKETNVESYGKTKRKWIANYETGEVIEFEDSKHTKLRYGDNLAVKEGLILNADPINMSDETSWGEGVTLHGVQEGDGYGWNGSEFKLDGKDDYIEIYTNNTKIEEGLTFEFYAHTDRNKIEAMLSKTTKDPDNFTVNRFRTALSEKVFSCCMSNLDAESDWRINTTNNKHWIAKEVDGNFNDENGGYLTMTVDLKKDTISIYWNGEYVDSTTASHEWMISGGLTDASIPFTIGMRVGGKTYTELYSRMDLYACRLYNKVLTTEEVKSNYDLTVSYHNLLEQDGEF